MISYTFPVVCGGCLKIVEVTDEDPNKAFTLVMKLVELKRGECDHDDRRTAG